MDIYQNFCVEEHKLLAVLQNGDYICVDVSCFIFLCMSLLLVEKFNQEKRIYKLTLKKNVLLAEAPTF